MHQHVRFAGKRQAREHLAVAAIEHDERSAVGGTEETVAIEPQAMRARRRHGERPLDQESFAVDDDDLGRLADVGVDTVALLVVDSPARPSGQRQLGDDAHRLEVDDGGAAVLAQRLAEVERVQTPPVAVVGEPVRVRPDLDAADELLVGAAKDAHARRGAVAREQQVVVLVDQDAGDTGQAGQRAEQGPALTVEHVDAVGTGVRHVQPPPGPVAVGVVEAGLGAGW